MGDKKLTAMVTGASSGLGAEFCRQLADRCDVIIAVARRQDRLLSLAEELRGQVEMHCVAADLVTVEGVTLAVEAIRQKGPVDYLVNNAGFSTDGKFASLPMDSQKPMVDLHITAPLELCRAAIPFMADRGEGYIVNVSSVASMVPMGRVAVYGASKAFLNFFSLSLQQEVARDGIKVQSLCPGYTHTEFHNTEALAEFDKSKVPPEFWSEPADVVRASLEGLEGDKVLVVAGESNLGLARMGYDQQLEALTAG